MRMSCPGLFGNIGVQNRGKPTAFRTSFHGVPAPAVTVMRSRSNFAPERPARWTWTPSVTVWPFVECAVLRMQTGVPDASYFLSTAASAAISAGCSMALGVL
jgi:hypothetical protein